MSICCTPDLAPCSDRCWELQNADLPDSAIGATSVCRCCDALITWTGHSRVGSPRTAWLDTSTSMPQVCFSAVDLVHIPTRTATRFPTTCIVCDERRPAHTVVNGVCATCTHTARNAQPSGDQDVPPGARCRILHQARHIEHHSPCPDHHTDGTITEVSSGRVVVRGGYS